MQKERVDCLCVLSVLVVKLQIGQGEAWHHAIVWTHVYVPVTKSEAQGWLLCARLYVQKYVHVYKYVNRDMRARHSHVTLTWHESEAQPCDPHVAWERGTAMWPSRGMRARHSHLENTAKYTPGKTTHILHTIERIYTYIYIYTHAYIRGHAHLRKERKPLELGSRRRVPTTHSSVPLDW
jgi:hypothetical protein